MINFKDKRYYNLAVKDNLQNWELLKGYASHIHKDLDEHKTNFFYLGAHLIDLYISNAYAITFDREHLRSVGSLSIGAENCCAECFFEYCYNEFGLDKTQVSRYMNIVDEFGTAYNYESRNEPFGFQKRWQGFSYSQLCELLPLTPEQRNPIKSNWTIRQIREYKKSLTAPAKLSDAPEIPEEPPQTKYSRFDKWTRIELCDKIFDLEEEYAELMRQYEELKTET